MQKKLKKETTHTRVNYEDPSMKFLDWVDHLGFERTWFGRILLQLEEKYQIRKFSFVFLFSIVLAYSINFEVKAPFNFTVGEVAKNDVSSPMNFEMVDEVTTEEKRLKAESTVPLIFDYDPLVFEKASGGIYKSFRIMRSLLKNTMLVKHKESKMDIEEFTKEFFSHKSEFENELGVSVPDYLFEWLVVNRFSPKIENIMIRNLEVWYQYRLVEGLDRIVTPGLQTILARTVNKSNKGKEFPIKRIELVDTTQLDSFQLVNTKGLEKVSPVDKAHILTLTRLMIFPNLTLNKQEIESRKQSARQSILPITNSIKKNQVIVTEGTVIQPFHMAMIKEIESLRSDRRHDVMAISMALLFSAIIVVFFQYLRRFGAYRLKVEDKDIFFMGVVTLFIVFFLKIFIFLTETSFASKFGSILPSSTFLYAAPAAAGPMIVGLVITSGEVLWLFTAFLSLVLGLMTEMNFTFMIVSFASGIAAARGVYSCKKRNDIYWAGIRTGAVNALMVALLLTVARFDQESFVREIVSSVPAGFLGGIFASMLTMIVIPFVESIFRYTTDVKLLELSNLNHPLLKEMIVKSPGTYHHSMLVGSMVEAAAEEIGANPLLGKVMCYYHDIGKMAHPNYFIENQKPGNNPHDGISPFMSKTLLVAHVKDGVELGIKHKLGKPIIDGIIQHHGTTLISYFYNKALDQKSDGDPEISEEEFRYPGPKPQFREAALCMLADSIEAASRSLDEPTPVRLQNIVRNIIQRKFMEGQLDECSLTLKDLSKVESAFTRILLGIYHQRIDYPRSAGGGASESPKVTPFFSGIKN